MSTRKTALITGANKGIGREIARQLGHRRYSVWLGCRDAEPAEAVPDVGGMGFEQVVQAILATGGKRCIRPVKRGHHGIWSSLVSFIEESGGRRRPRRTPRRDTRSTPRPLHSRAAKGLRRRGHPGAPARTSALSSERRLPRARQTPTTRGTTSARPRRSPWPAATRSARARIRRQGRRRRMARASP